MKALLEFKGKIFYDEDLITCLDNCGLKRGDTVCVHSELFGFGTPLLTRAEFLSAILKCFWQVLGEKGTLLMPTFTYSFCKNLAFDKANSKSTMGVLSEFFRKQNGVFRTNEPIFSFGVAGFKQEAFSKDYASCFGKGCVYDTLTKENGKIMLFGTQDLGYTFTHFVEEEAKVSYRYYKDFSGLLINEKGEKFTKSIRYFVRNLNKNSVLSIAKQRNLLKSTNNFVTVNFAGKIIVLIKAVEYKNEFLRVFEKDENALLEDKR